MKHATGPLLLLHGGAGVPPRDKLTPDVERDVRAGLTTAAMAGQAILMAGGRAVDAVEAAVRVMENDPVFNAGYGGALTSAGHVEHDAAIMDGRDRRAGAVAQSRRIANPVSLARHIMEDGRHVLLVGDGAEGFARQKGVPFVDPRSFITERRLEALAKVQAGRSKHDMALNEQDRHGTVGAVALDRNGDLAAATSTGGRTNKLPGRVGDTPLIGAGTYADNRSVAVSCTGNGEHFMRGVIAHRLALGVEWLGLDIKAAADKAMAELATTGGTGGLIAIDRNGNWTMPFNTSGMYRAIVHADGQLDLGIYGSA